MRNPKSPLFIKKSLFRILKIPQLCLVKRRWPSLVMMFLMRIVWMGISKPQWRLQKTLLKIKKSKMNQILENANRWYLNLSKKWVIVGLPVSENGITIRDLHQKLHRKQRQFVSRLRRWLQRSVNFISYSHQNVKPC